jgi:hypothetical protein
MSTISHIVLVVPRSSSTHVTCAIGSDEWKYAVTVDKDRMKGKDGIQEVHTGPVSELVHVRMPSQTI